MNFDVIFISNCFVEKIHVKKKKKHEILEEKKAKKKKRRSELFKHTIY